MATLEDSNGMEYNEEDRRWVLLQSTIITELGIDLASGDNLGSETEALIFTDEISEVVNDFLKENPYNHSNDVRFSHEAWFEFFLFKDNFGERLSLKKIMLAMVRYFDRSGGHIIGDELGTDLETTTFIDSVNKWREDRIMSSQALRVARKSRLYFQGSYNQAIPEDEYRVGY